MRIAQIYSRFEIDGISLLMLKTSIILSKLGHNCSIITPRGIFSPSEIAAKKTDTRFQMYVLDHVRALVKLGVAIRILGLDVLHVHSYWVYPFTNFFLIMGRFLARKVIWTPQVHAAHENTMSNFNSVFRPLLKLYYRYVGPYLARRVDVVIACTNSEAQLLRQWGVRRIVTIPTPVEELFLETFVEKDFRGMLRLLYVGRVSTAKGIDTLIEAMKRLSELGVSFLLRIVGPKYVDFPEDRLIDWPQVVKDAKLDKNIVFVGPISSRTQLRDLYLESDVFVFPSKPIHAEAFPTVILEALATGLPIVSTNVGYVSEMIKDGKNGFIVPPDDPVAMAEAIYTLAKNPETACGMMKFNYERRRRLRLRPIDYATDLLQVYRDSAKIIRASSSTAQNLVSLAGQQGME